MPANIHQLLVAANDRTEAARRRWGADGYLVVAQPELVAANARVDEARHLVAALDDSTYRVRRAQLFVGSLRNAAVRLLCLDRLDWPVAAALLGTIPCAACPLLLAVFRVPLWLSGPIFAASYLVPTAAAAALLYRLDHSGFAGKLANLAHWIEQRRFAIAQAKKDCAVAEMHVHQLVRVRRLQEEYEAAVEEVRRLEEVQRSRRHELLRVNWRVLRGDPFQDFLADVFRELGYGVQVTGRTGDHGADLVLTDAAGLRIAVQAKGYEGNVGPEAVREALMGRAVYGCHRLVAVTNSAFTPPAREEARVVGCLLIDGALLPQLIEGRIRV